MQWSKGVAIQVKMGAGQGDPSVPTRPCNATQYNTPTHSPQPRNLLQPTPPLDAPRRLPLRPAIPRPHRLLVVAVIRLAPGIPSRRAWWRLLILLNKRAAPVLLPVSFALTVAVAVGMALCAVFVAVRAPAAGDAQPDVFVLAGRFFVDEVGGAAARRGIEDCFGDGQGERVVVGQGLHP